MEKNEENWRNLYIFGEYLQKNTIKLDKIEKKKYT